MVKRIQDFIRRAQNERGMALLATMLAIALMTIIVMDFTSSSALGYLSAANNANEIRAAYLARSGVNVGLALLAQDTRTQTAQQANASGGVAAQPQKFDSFASVWAIPFPPMPVNGGTIQLSVVDEARKFDINRLVYGTLPLSGTGQPGTGTGSGTTQPGDPNQPAPAPTTGQGSPSVGQGTANGTQLVPGQIDPIAVAQLQRLIGLLGLPLEIVPAIVDWLDRDSIESQGGAEADYYLHLIPPYEPRNGPMPTLGDLRLVKGIDDAMFMKLRNYLTVAPEPMVNVNTAPPEVIACMDPALTSNTSIVQQILQARSIRPFASLKDVPGLTEASGGQGSISRYFNVTAQYFTISGMGTFAGARKLVFATFHRNPDGTATLGSWQED